MGGWKQRRQPRDTINTHIGGGMRVAGNSRGQRSPSARRIPGEKMSKEQRAAMSAALERDPNDRSVRMPYLRFLDPEHQKVKT